MKHRVIFILLLISLAFNTGFIVMFVYHRQRMPHRMMPRPPTGYFNKQQIDQDEGIKQIRQENMELRKQFFTELAKEEFGSEAIYSFITQLEDSQSQLEHQVLHYFVNMREGMTAEEAEEVFGKFVDRYDKRQDRANNPQNNNENRHRRNRTGGNK